MPAEFSYQIWLAECISTYFRNQGFEVNHSSQTQRAEKFVPFDLQFRVRRGDFAKGFGIQVKRPHARGRDLVWPIDPRQHETLNNYPWIYYGLPAFVDEADQTRACEKTAFTRAEGRRTEVSMASMPSHDTWTGFARSLELCQRGVRIPPDSVWPARRADVRAAADILGAVNYSSKQVTIGRS